MLDYIRSNTQSFGVKLAFGIIILVFVFWGVGSFSDQNSANIVAKVNGEPILAQEFMQSLQRAEEQILRANPSVTREQLKQQHLGRQVLNELVRQTLVAQEARRVGISISPLELHKVVSRIPSFQNEQGQFDAKVYTRVLEAQRISPAQYEEDLSRQLLQEKVMRLITASAWDDPQEARELFNFLQEQRVVDYIFVPAADFKAEVRLDDKEITAYYNEHKAEFAIPPMVDVAYVRVSPETLVKPESVSEADARKWYDANKGHFEEPRQVKAAHILVPLSADKATEADRKKAEETIARIQAELKSGKDFAAVADAYNGPNAAGPGGELGWITPGKTVKPFEDAAFALKAGEVSEPVQSPFGLHIIKVFERKEGGIRPFADVLSEVRATVAQERGVEKLSDALDSLIEDNILGKPLADSAARLGLKAEQTGLLDEAALQSRLGISADGAASLISTAAGAPVDTALEAGDSYIVARISKSEPASTKTLDAVKEDISARLTAAKSLQLAMDKAVAIRKELKDGPLSAEQKKAFTVETVAEPVRRGTFLQGFTPEPLMDAALFQVKVGQWLPTAYSVVNTEKGPGALLCHVDKKLDVDEKAWEAARETMLRADVSMRAEGLFQLFMQKLVARAEVLVLNKSLVDQVNM